MVCLYFLPCAAHDLWSVEGEGVRVVRFGTHDVGFCQHCICEEVIGLEEEF